MSPTPTSSNNPVPSIGKRSENAGRRPGRYQMVFTSPCCRRRSSLVTRRELAASAVATMNRSAGSPCMTKESARRATSAVNGSGSTRGIDSNWAAHSATEIDSASFRLRTSTAASHKTIVGIPIRSACAIADLPSRPKRAGSSVHQSAAWVSSTSTLLPAVEGRPGDVGGAWPKELRLRTEHLPFAAQSGQDLVFALLF